MVADAHGKPHVPGDISEASDGMLKADVVYGPH